MSVTDPLEEIQAAPEDIGAILRNAREAAGYSIADVAQRLRLSRHHIENLEAERFDLFPVSVFLRGYLTSYARLLGIDSDPLLEAYDRRGFGPPQLHSQDSARSPARGSEFTVTVTTLVVIAVLIVLSALWWREQWTEEDLLTSPPSAQTERGDRPAGIGGDDAETALSGLSGAGEAANGAAVPGGTLESPGDSLPAAGSDAATAPAPDAVSEEAPGRELGRVELSAEAPETGPEPETQAAAAAATAALPPAEADAPGDAAAQPAAGAPEGQASLVIRVNDDCWLMIRDAEQRLVYRDLAAAGTVLELSAVPPIRVVAGYAHGLEIEFDGAPFDLAPYIEQETGTARFELGS